MKLSEVFLFIRRRRLAVISTVDAACQPEAALIGFAFDPRIGLVFDTSSASRKARNLRARPRAAIVIGWEDQATVQLEGAACEPSGCELSEAKAAYFAAWPDGRGRETWADIAYFLIKPAWIRYSAYGETSTIVEFREAKEGLLF
jgi:pyridoxine/pyridoxamine 5'-phosphate oxidase